MESAVNEEEQIHFKEYVEQPCLRSIKVIRIPKFASCLSPETVITCKSSTETSLSALHQLG